MLDISSTYGDEIMGDPKEANIEFDQLKYFKICIIRFSLYHQSVDEKIRERDINNDGWIVMIGSKIERRMIRDE